MQILKNTRSLIFRSNKVFNPFTKFSKNLNLNSFKSFSTASTSLNTKLLDKINLENSKNLFLNVFKKFFFNLSFLVK